MVSDLFLRLQRDQRLHLWYIGQRKQSFLRNHAIPPFTFLTPVGNRGITPCVCVKEPSRSPGVIPTAGGLYGHKGTVCCRHIRLISSAMGYCDVCVAHEAVRLP